MSDLMLHGILRMPLEMAMGDKISQYQFYERAQEALDRMIIAEDRIAELEKEKARAFNNGYETGQKALTTNAEPVAWTNDFCLDLLKQGHEANLWTEKEKDEDDIPLYTTPQTKPLSDEEINKLLIPITNINIWDKPNELVKLARAIEERHGIK